MGITWVTDVISWIHVTLNVDHGHALWIVPDLINAFHGVFIFIVVGCQPQVSFKSISHTFRIRGLLKIQTDVHSLNCRF